MNNKENTNKMVKDECINHIHLIDVANVLYGYPLQAKNFCEDSSYLPVVRIRDIKAGFSTTYYRESVPMEYIVHLGDILVGMDGEFNLSKWRSREAILNQRVCKIESKDESIILNQYLFHLLGPIFKKIEKNIQGSTVKHLSAKIINSIKIPLPPLPIQQEIVRILDTFTNFTAELTDKLNAELTARRKQYEYYRDELLTFGEDVEYKKLGEVVSMKAGKAIKAQDIGEKNELFSIPCYGGNGLRGYVKDANCSGDKVLIGRQGALCGNVCFVSGEFYATEHAVVVSSDNNVDMRFLFHLLLKLNLNQYKTAGAQPGLSVSKLETVKVQIPSIEYQRRVSKVLDLFSRYIDNLEDGLPAEISARQKQYEYYRGKLLRFS